MKAFGESLFTTVSSRISAAIAESMANNVLKGFGMGPLAGSGGSGGGVDWASLIGKLFSWDGGGYTGSGSRSGGLDGKGGFLAMMHPRETVIDHTKGGGSGVSVTIVNQTGTPVQGTAQQKGMAPDGTQLIEIVLAAAGDAVANRSGPLARGLEAGYGLRPAMT